MLLVHVLDTFVRSSETFAAKLAKERLAGCMATLQMLFDVELGHAGVADCAREAVTSHLKEILTELFVGHTTAFGVDWIADYCRWTAASSSSFSFIAELIGIVEVKKLNYTFFLLKLTRTESGTCSMNFIFSNGTSISSFFFFSLMSTLILWVSIMCCLYSTDRWNCRSQ